LVALFRFSFVALLNIFVLLGFEVTAACPLPQPNFSFLNLARVLLLSASETKAKGVILMEWTTPQHEEIDLNCEISSYANAEL
jgi:hypothetical protein